MLALYEARRDITLDELRLDRAARHLRDYGIDVPDTLLARVAPLSWEHISLTGDYLWSKIEKPRDRSRALRTTGSVARP